jgi:hypothetical protein
MLITELLALLRAEKIKVNSNRADRWFFLTGDANVLEYGGTYAEITESGWINAVNFSGRDWDGYTREKLYTTSDHSLDFSDLATQFSDYASYSGLDDDTEDYDLDAGMFRLIDAAISYGFGHSGGNSGTNAADLLPCGINKGYARKNFFAQIP